MFTSSSPVPRPQGITSGRRSRTSQTDSSGETLNPSEETAQPTGMKYVAVRKRAPSNEFLPMYTYDIIIHSEELAQIIYNLLSGWLQCKSFGGTLVLANHTEPGKKPVVVVTLRIPSQNGGMDTRVKRMLSLMSFEVLFSSPTYFDDLTSTQYVFRRREPTSHFVRQTSGSPRTWTLDPGILTWIQNLLEPYLEG